MAEITPRQRLPSRIASRAAAGLRGYAASKQVVHLGCQSQPRIAVREHQAFDEPHHVELGTDPATDIRPP